LESEVFLLGRWKNFDELESELSLQELMAVIDAIRKKDNDSKKFLAAVNGVDLDAEEESNDVTDLQNRRVADLEGFGENQGLGFMRMGEDEWQE
jgi:hypothetical protein